MSKTLAAALLLAAGVQHVQAAAQISQKPINITIPDSSPMLVYLPPEADPALPNYKYNADLWNTTFVRRPWTEWQANTLGRGESSHRTTKAGNSVSVTWLGTGVYFHGGCEEDCKVTLSINGGPEKEFTPGPGYEGGGPLAFYNDYDAENNTQNTAVLTLKQGAMSVQRAYLTSIIPTYASDVTETTQNWLNTTTGTDLNLNPAIDSKKPDGSVWKGVHELGNDLDRMIYRRIDTNMANSYAQFRVPANSTLVSLWGTMNLDHGNFSVTVTPPPPGSKTEGKTLLNGFATWSIVDTPLYMAPLDPNTDYTLRLENLEDEKYLDLASARFYTLDPANGASQEPVTEEPQSHGLSAGAIAGIAIGSVLGAMLIGGLIGFLIWRRRNKHHYNIPGPYLVNDDERFEVDPTLQTTQYTVASSGSGRGSFGRGSLQTNDVSTLGYTHFTPLGEENPTDEKAGVIHHPAPSRPAALAPLAMDLKRQLAGFESVPLSPSGSGRNSFSRNGSGLLVPPPESEFATYASGSTASNSHLGTNAGPSHVPGHARGSHERRRPRAPLVDYVNAQDAGPVPTTVTQVEMPPSYNPEWAESGSLASTGTGQGQGTPAAQIGQQEGERTEPGRMNSIVRAAKGLL